MAESVQVQAVSSRHEAFADALLANPGMRKQDIAKMFNVSPVWFSIVTNSDVFKEYFEARRAGFNDELRKQLVQRQLEVGIKSYDRLNDMLDDPELKPEHALAAVDRTLKFAGYEPRSPGSRTTEERILELEHPVDAGALANARAKMTRRITQTIEHGANAPGDSLAQAPIVAGS
jgi:hypothetical protein